MQLTIAEPAPARVTLPFRLRIDAASLPAFQGQALSHRTYVDATVDRGPEDFATDRERLAARDLAEVLASESARACHGHRDTPHLQAGMVIIEVRSPYEEREIRQAALIVVADAARQAEFAAATLATFKAWIPLGEKALRTATEALILKT